MNLYPFMAAITWKLRSIHCQQGLIIKRNIRIVRSGRSHKTSRFYLVKPPMSQAPLWRNMQRSQAKLLSWENRMHVLALPQNSVCSARPIDGLELISTSGQPNNYRWYIKHGNRLPFFPDTGTGLSPKVKKQPEPSAFLTIPEIQPPLHSTGILP